MGPMDTKMVESNVDSMPTDRIVWRDFALLAIGMASLLADLYVVRTINNNKCLQTPTRLYIMNWAILDIAYLIFAEGISKFVEMIVDPTYELDFIVLALQKTLQGNTVFFPIVYLIDVNIQNGRLKATNCLKFFWIQCIVCCLFICIVIIYIAPAVSLFGVALFILLIFLTIYEIETTLYFRKSFSTCKRIMLTLISVHVVSWFLYYWIVVGIVTKGWEHYQLYEFFALCLAHLSSLDKIYILIRFDSIFRCHIYKLDLRCLPNESGVPSRPYKCVSASYIISQQANKITKQGSVAATRIM